MSYSLLSPWYFVFCFHSHLYFPVTKHNALESIISCCNPPSFFFFFLLLYHFFHLFTLSLQWCLSCFALLSHPISSFRSFSQNPYCLFHNISIFLLLSLVHICPHSCVPCCFVLFLFKHSYMSFRNAGARAALREHNHYIQCTEIFRIKKTFISGRIFILPVYSFLWSETTESAQNSDCKFFFPHHTFVFVGLSIWPWACSLAIWQPLTAPARGQNAVQLPTWSFLHCVYF